MASWKRPEKNFLTMRLIWHSINAPECKVELNFNNFSGRNWCFDAMCLIILHYFTRLVESDVSFAWMIPLEMHFLLILLIKPNLQKSASIDDNSLACWFSHFIERCDVIVTHYFTKIKCFSYRRLPKLAYCNDSIYCLLWFCSRAVKSCFHKKNGDDAQDARDIA